jgi:DnaA family protein
MKQIALDIGLATGPKLTTFCPGANQAALSHLLLWSASGTRSPVPTYLWGDAGSGKTHLLRGVRDALGERGEPVGWMDALTLEPPAFDERWGAVLLDEVHLYTAVQQQAAFNWFVNAQTLLRGVVAAGRLPPADLPLREDLRTRLGWGHVFQLQVLSEPERLAVLRQEAGARGVALSAEVMEFMSRRFSRDLGSLMQLLDHLDGYGLATQRPITIPLIKSMLEDR